MHKHKWSWTVKFDPDHFGRDPFRAPGHIKPSRWLNVGALDLLAPHHGSRLDLESMGVEKLLGSGTVAGAYEVRVESFTKRAQAKIQAAGGKIIE